MTEPETTAQDSDFIELRLAAAVQVNFRAWFYPFVLAIGALVTLGAAHPPDLVQASHLAILLAYMSLACTFCPLPTTPVVLWAAAPAVSHGLGLDPLVLATVCMVGTCAANMNDYYLVTFLYRYRRVQRIRRTRLYEKAAAWFERAPLATLTAASFLPIPIDVVRLLAISQGYSRGKFALATALGRWPRYLALAYFAERFSIGWQWILAILGVTVVLGLYRGLPRIAGTLRGFLDKEQAT